METKSRTRVVPEGHEEVVFYPASPRPGDEPYTKVLWNQSYTPRSESYTPNSKGSKAAWKPFQHFKSVQAESSQLGQLTLRSEERGYVPHHYEGVSSNPFRGYWQEWWSSYGSLYGDAGMLDDGLPAFYVPQVDGGFVAPAPDLESLKRRALSSMLPGIKAELSLPNFIYELKDFRRPLKQLASQIRSLAVLKQGLTWKTVGLISYLNARQAIKGFRAGLTAKSLVRMVASGYLNLNFNILPLISDIRKIASALSRTKGRINDLINRSGSTQTRHFRYVWQEYENSKSEKEGGYWNWQNQDQTLQVIFGNRDVYYSPTVFHAQLQFNYNFTEAQVAHAQLYGHLDALGITLNPAIIWNAIPFSFVVDWVLGVSQYLDTLAEKNLEPTINIHSFLWSVLRQRRIVVQKGLRSSPAYGFPRQTNTCPVVNQTAYRRDVGTPSASLIESSGLSLKEFSLGAALVIARNPRRK